VARATKNRSRPAAFVGFFSATFLQLLETYGFLYRNRKNVIYSRNVMRGKNLLRSAQSWTAGRILFALFLFLIKLKTT
jgi:hypothetical protein